MGTTSGYVAVGLSDDTKMGDDSVTQCVYNNAENRVQGAQSFNNGKSNVPLSNPDQDLSMNASASMYVGGKVICEFTRSGQQNVEGKQFNLLDNSYYLLIAVGSASSRESIQPHSTTPPAMWVSGSSARLTDTQVLGSGASTRYLVTIHVLLLVSCLRFLYSNSMF
jgi:hypothetical protein